MKNIKNIFLSKLLVLFVLLILFGLNNINYSKIPISSPKINSQKTEKEDLNKNKNPNKNIILNKLAATFPLDLEPLLSQEVITSHFGYRVHPISYKLDFHPAIDISAPYKSNIHAILSGTVKEVGKSKIYGNYIIISHDNNLESKYCHCDQIFLKKDSYVSKGQVISNVGNTGLVTGAHLHLEIKINNINIDPLLLIKI